MPGLSDFHFAVRLHSVLSLWRADAGRNRERTGVGFDLRIYDLPTRIFEIPASGVRVAEELDVTLAAVAFGR